MAWAGNKLVGYSAILVGILLVAAFFIFYFSSFHFHMAGSAPNSLTGSPSSHSVASNAAGTSRPASSSSQSSASQPSASSSASSAASQASGANQNSNQNYIYATWWNARFKETETECGSLGPNRFDMKTNELAQFKFNCDPGINYVLHLYRPFTGIPGVFDVYSGDTKVGTCRAPASAGEFNCTLTCKGPGIYSIKASESVSSVSFVPVCAGSVSGASYCNWAVLGVSKCVHCNDSYCFVPYLSH